MNNEDYCSYEVSKLLKEKGFDEPCRGVYEEKVLRINTLCDWLNSDFSEYVAAPTQAMACDWLIENYKIYINVSFVSGKGYVGTIYEISDFNEAFDIVETKYYSCIEPVYNEALKYILTNLI